MWPFLAFLALPVIEIAVFVLVGGQIGLWPTLGLVLLGAAIGVLLMRSQGARALQVLRQSLATQTNPAEPLAHGAMILLAGALLVVPGFFTDLIGLSLLVPAVRLAVFRRLRARVSLRGVGFGMQGASGQPAEENVIEGEFKDITPTHQSSELTRH